MKKKKLRRASCALLALGLILTAWGLGALLGTRDVLQYAIVAPSGEKRAEEVTRLVEAKQATEEELAECTSAITIGGVTSQESVSADQANATATVVYAGEGWFEVYPVAMAQGRRITETELKRGDQMAMLDEELAFALLGADFDENAKVTVGGEEYTVVGTFRYRRGVGAASGNRVYLPLMAATGARMDAMMVSALPIPNSGARTMFGSKMENDWQAGGCLYSLEKEVMRRTMPLRVLLVVFGFGMFFALMRRMNGVAAQQIERFREGMREAYFGRMIPRLLGTAGIFLAGYGGLLAALYALAAFSITPLYVFTEWVPENIVEWSSITDVFWNLIKNAARVVKVGTEEMHAVEFWGGILRWGVLCALCGALLIRVRPVKNKSGSF